MSQVLTLDKPTQSVKFQHPFLQELIKQIRKSNAFDQYSNWSDEFLINQLILSNNKKVVSQKEITSIPFNQVLTSAFYKAIGATIEKQTGHPTNTFVHLKDQKLSSAVICCGGVLVLSSLIGEYLNVNFLSLQNLIELAETNIGYAINKASQYLDFVS